MNSLFQSDWKRRHPVTQEDLDTLVLSVLGMEPKTLHILVTRPLYYTEHNLRPRDKLLKYRVITETTGF